MARLSKIRSDLMAVAHKSLRDNQMALDLRKKFPATLACVVNEVVTSIAEHVYNGQSEEEKESE